MRRLFRKPVVVFFLFMIVFSAILFLIPINLFDGEILFEHSAVWQPEKLSLSYFVGIGSSGSQINGIVDYRLVGMGYFLAFLILIALPALIAYRVKLANEAEARRNEK